MLAPAVPLDEADREALDAVPAAGGTLILAGPPGPFEGYLETLGIEATSGPLVRQARTPDGGLEVQVDTRQRLSGSGTAPLLVAPDGRAVAVRKPYLAGQVLVLTSVRSVHQRRPAGREHGPLRLPAAGPSRPARGDGRLRRVALPGGDRLRATRCNRSAACCARRPQGGRPCTAPP